jgi:ubiquinone/menaquinone biosynthesis C-methylase UbiE
VSKTDGAAGWDAYAPFYDWENARTMGRRDLTFWKQRGAIVRGRVLELGCGTGRLTIPMARAGIRMMGIDRSAAMLLRARRRAARLPRGRRPLLARGDIRTLPYPGRTFALVMAPYGMLQSLTSDADLDAALREVARVLTARGRLVIDLVPDLPHWPACHRQVSLRGRLGRAPVTLIESVRQDRRRGLTLFHEEFVTRVDGRLRRRRFTLAFRTLAMRDLIARLGRAGLEIEYLSGRYGTGVWHAGADVWLIEARPAGASRSPAPAC